MASTNMPPVTVYILKKDRLALLDDLTDIIKDENITLTSRCIERLEDCLKAKLEPTLIPYDCKDPTRAIDMTSSARLRSVKADARVERRTTTSKNTAESHRKPGFIPHVRFGKFGGPRNINESFMDRDFVCPDGAPESEDEDEALAIVRAEKHRLESRDEPSIDTYNRFGGPRNVNESFISTANLVRETRSTNKPSTAVKATKKIKQRANVLMKDEPIDTTKGDLLISAPKTPPEEVEPASLIGYQPERKLASLNEVMENPELTIFKANNEIARKTQTGTNINICKTHLDVKHALPSIPTITVTEAAVDGIQSSLASSNSSQHQSSLGDTREPQDTLDSTYFNQSQGPAGSQAIEPNQLLQTPAPAARKKKAPRASKKAVEIIPRRSARLAKKEPPPAPKAHSPANIAPPPVLKSSTKRRHEHDAEDEGGEESSGPNKKVVSKAVVEKQRETRGKETTKRSGRDLRTVLQRRGV